MCPHCSWEFSLISLLNHCLLGIDVGVPPVIIHSKNGTFHELSPPFWSCPILGNHHIFWCLFSLQYGGCIHHLRPVRRMGASRKNPLENTRLILKDIRSTSGWQQHSESGSYHFTGYSLVIPSYRHKPTLFPEKRSAKVRGKCRVVNLLASHEGMWLVWFRKKNMPDLSPHRL